MIEFQQETPCCPKCGAANVGMNYEMDYGIDYLILHCRRCSHVFKMKCKDHSEDKNG